MDNNAIPACSDWLLQYVVYLHIYILDVQRIRVVYLQAQLKKSTEKYIPMHVRNEALTIVVLLCLIFTPTLACSMNRIEKKPVYQSGEEMTM